MRTIRWPRATAASSTPASTLSLGSLPIYSTTARGWLILFYGGAEAMRKGSGLSAGELVTYQLYFNKIQCPTTSS